MKITEQPINENILAEKFASKAQQRYFYAKANEKGAEGEKFKKMAKEFSDKTDYKHLPEKVTETKTSRKNEYGCLMLDFKIPMWNKVLDKIDKNDIYDGEDFGLEHDPHITILFGFEDDKFDYANLEKFITSIKNVDFDVELSGISHFESKEYDVVKFDCKSEVLNKLNKFLIEHFPVVNNFPEYHPHMTIAYVKKGSASKYDIKLKTPIHIKPFQITWSSVSGDKKKYDLGK